MTIHEIIDRIIAYHPSLGEKEKTTCDTLKYGDASQECTGIATTIYVSPTVIEKAHSAGCNLLLTHEPSFYHHMDPLDWLINNSVAHAKMELLDKYHMVIFRDHDHIHAHRPDGIFYGLTKELGWEDYLITDMKQPAALSGIMFKYQLPDIPLKDIANQFIEKLNLNNVRIIGNPKTIVKKAAIAAHLFPGSQKVISAFDHGDYDLLLPGEFIDWEIAEYFKDAGDFGMNKAMIQLGHFNWEELGMKFAVTWISELVEHQIPCVYCCNDDMYNYILRQTTCHQ